MTPAEAGGAGRCRAHRGSLRQYRTFLRRKSGGLVACMEAEGAAGETFLIGGTPMRLQ